MSLVKDLLEHILECDAVNKADSCWVLFHFPDGTTKIHMLDAPIKTTMQLYSSAGLCFNFGIGMAKVDGVPDK